MSQSLQENADGKAIDNRCDNLISTSDTSPSRRISNDTLFQDIFRSRNTLEGEYDVFEYASMTQSSVVLPPSITTLTTMDWVTIATIGGA